GFAVFAVLGFFAALIPSVLRDALHVRSVAIAGAIVGEAFVVGAIAVATVRRAGLNTALLLFPPSLALVVAAQLARSLELLLAGTALAGVATGLGYVTCLQRVNDIAPEDRRAEVVSAFIIVCYIAISLPVIGIGLVAHATSLAVADTAFAGL